MQNSQLWRARTYSIWKVQRGGLYTTLAQAIRSILHFRWGLYLFSTKFDSPFSESSRFPDFYVWTLNFGGQYLKTRAFFGKTLLLNAVRLGLVRLPWMFQLDIVQNVQGGEVSILVGRHPCRQKEITTLILGGSSLARRSTLFINLFTPPLQFSSTLWRGRLWCAYTLSTER